MAKLANASTSRSMRARSVRRLRWLLALCVVALVAVWSFHALSRNVWIVLHSGGYLIRVRDGGVDIYTYLNPDNSFPPPSWPMQGVVYADWSSVRNALPAAEHDETAMVPGSTQGATFQWVSLFAVSWWLSASIIALTVWRAWPHWRRVRAARDQMCERCGYALMGLAGATCPECGHGAAQEK